MPKRLPKFAEPIYASSRPGNISSFEEMSQGRQAVGSTVSDLNCPRFKLQTSRPRDERFTAQPTDRYRFSRYDLKDEQLNLHWKVCVRVFPSIEPGVIDFGTPSCHFCLVGVINQFCDVKHDIPKAADSATAKGMVSLNGNIDI